MFALRYIARPLVATRTLNARLMSSDDSRPKIYTRTGDKGTSATFTGQRRRKDDAVFEALGATDELNSHIGYVRSLLGHPEVSKQLKWVQCLLQDLQAAIATPNSSASEGHKIKTEFPAEHIKELEQWIDAHSESLPPLRNFILPSGSPAGAALHVARSVCRRAERRVTTLFLDDEVDEVVMRYINRLSDYLFVAARICSHHENAEEVIYK
uniref:Corrinoid adenosyltransferase MMAB n=1 Tax=Amblyomma triste TaxID=251400 RepID=A0A023G480_AMBTT